MNESRLAALRQRIEEQKLDTMLLQKEVNLHYFSGFRGDSAIVVVTKDRTLLITDSRFTEQAEKQAPLCEVIEHTDGLWKKTIEILKKLDAKRVGIEGNVITFNEYRLLTKFLNGVELESVTPDDLREIKDAEELDHIRKACEIADRAFTDVLTFLRPGISEIAVAARLENCMRQLGSEEPAFTTIVVSGVRGSLPHGIATEKLILSGEFVTMDYGAVYAGYHSDMTRTVCIGKADEKQRRVYDAVLRAQQTALKEIRIGASGPAVDKAARESLELDGLAQYFGHGLGHSLGLEIHENPRLSPKSNCEHLMENMLVTDEPGVYIPDWGGLRIEDTVLVTKQGGVPLTTSDKQLIEIL